LTKGDAGKLMLESIPDPSKRERRRDVIEKGLESPHFQMAVARLLELYDDMERQLKSMPWLASDQYTIADAAFTPYVVRLDHLDILGILADHPRVVDWYSRIKTRPSFSDAITKWENPDYLSLMKRQGQAHWEQVKQVAMTPSRSNRDQQKVCERTW
jgi:hypothetical protein